MTSHKQNKVLVVTLGKHHEKPWWWAHIERENNKCQIDYQRLVYKDKHSQEINTYEFPSLFFHILKAYTKWHKQYDYIFTFECDLLGFFISIIQNFMIWKGKPRHVILQFIMREKTSTITSKIKYLIMKLCFRSLHKAVCSSSLEARYYCEAFDWPNSKTVFVPFHTDPNILNIPTRDDGYVFSGGKSFRDFTTLIQSLENASYNTIIIGHKAQVSNKNVKMITHVPLKEFLELMAHSSIVIVSLEDRKISTGQTILLHAMALGKPVIATNTTGTFDYIEAGKNGILVQPNNPSELSKQIDILLKDESLRDEIGKAAKYSILNYYLPKHYVRNIYKTIIQNDMLC